MSFVTRRDFLKLGALFVPVVAAPTVAYSFLRAPMVAPDVESVLVEFRQAMAAHFQIPEYILFGGKPSPGLVTLVNLQPNEKPRAFAW